MQHASLSLENQSVLENFNTTLSKLKEEFHKTGRYDDANTKLDEILKLLVIKYFDVVNSTNLLGIESLQKVARVQFGSEKKIANALQVVFSKVVSEPLFINNDGSNVFGSNAHLNIQDTDDEFALKIVEAISRIELSHSDQSDRNIDILNEAFGHFVRDNFRNHKEDAQYMTPGEVVDAAIEIAFKDILTDKKALSYLFSEDEEGFIVLDPTCGVGSFLTYSFKSLSKVINEADIDNKDYILSLRKKCSFIGQDKVDRMVRMSKINYLLSGLNPELIQQGNSIIGESFLDRYVGKVDLILTNPPFGAEFKINEIESEPKKYEFLSDIGSFSKVKTLYSELIMLDRCLKLLKPGGRLLIVVPDGIVSSKGINEVYRDKLSSRFILRGVIDLPAVTFAQAGTRTKCSILYIQKPYTNEFQQNGIFMAVANKIGYVVKERVGTATKIYSGSNDLSEIVQHYESPVSTTTPKILSSNPSVVIYPFDQLIHGKWNANFYGANRLEAVSNFQKVDVDEFEVIPLKKIAEFCTKSRKKRQVSSVTKHISILHINEDSTIKFEEVFKYNPISSGRECFEADILFSKINPRIPRVAVVVNLDPSINLSCSSEFEIIKPYEDKYTYLLKTMLLTDIFLRQVMSLTSGTSSSHNRIKDTELKDIKIPWPKKNTHSERKLLGIASEIEKSEKKKYEADQKIRSLYKELYRNIGV